MKSKRPGEEILGVILSVFLAVLGLFLSHKQAPEDYLYIIRASFAGLMDTSLF